MHTIQCLLNVPQSEFRVSHIRFRVGFSGFSMTDLIHIVQVCVCLYIGVFHPALPCVQSISVCLQMSHSPLGVFCVYVCV